jgi:hypothetical protein
VKVAVLKLETELIRAVADGRTELSGQHLELLSSLKSSTLPLSGGPAY